MHVVIFLAFENTLNHQSSSASVVSRVTVSINIKHVNKGGANGREEAGKSYFELFKAEFSVAILVELMELACSVASHQIEIRVFVESRLGDLLAALPDDFLVDVGLVRAEVERIVHRFVEFSIPLF
jgi:hypothetical protein